MLYIVLVTFTCYIYSTEKAIQPSTTDTNDDDGNARKKRIHEGMDLTKRAAQQSILYYILVFLLVYSGVIFAFILRIIKIENTAATFWFISSNFLNMLIYTRPKVQALKTLIPRLPMIKCFAIIILAGGETPSVADLGIEESERPILSTAPRQQEPLSKPEENSRGSNNINYWLEIFGYDFSFDEEDLDIEAELDKIMRRQYFPAKKKPHDQEEDDSMLEEGIEFEQFDEEGISIEDG